MHLKKTLISPQRLWSVIFDYAMVLLASRMGMRSGDIVNLRIGDVKDRTELNIIQVSVEVVTA